MSVIKCVPCWRYNPGTKDVLFLWLIASKLEGGFSALGLGLVLGRGILLEYPIRARLKNAIRIKIEETSEIHLQSFSLEFEGQILRALATSTF